jgi:hypothetical protein
MSKNFDPLHIAQLSIFNQNVRSKRLHFGDVRLSGFCRAHFVLQKLHWVSYLSSKYEKSIFRALGVQWYFDHNIKKYWTKEKTFPPKRSAYKVPQTQQFKKQYLRTLCFCG